MIQKSLNTEVISLDEIFQAIKKVRRSSAPSPFDQISYSIICNCPALVPALLNLYNQCWKRSEVPSLWKVASIQLIPKKSAQEDSSNPANFRPIALTPCISKLFSTIMKNRLISFMTSNRYFDKTIQKAFMPSVPGCVEHYVKLATAVHEAHSHHKSIAVCWLDLSNAYGSVHHNLISFSLSQYKAPEQFISLVNNLYSDLSASINTKFWSTSGIPLNKGVFQGDPLSVVIFNCVMNTYIDAIKPCLSSSYHFSNSAQSLGLLQYADDTCLVTDGPSSCQNLLNLTDLWLTWSGMIANISKCQCLAIRASSGKVYNPNLSLSDAKIPFIGNQPVKFLGGTIQVPSNPQNAFLKLQDKVQILLRKVDNTPVIRKQKMLLYKLGVCPRITWDLTINNFSLSRVESLDPLVTKYLKSWLGLARPADPSKLLSTTETWWSWIAMHFRSLQKATSWESCSPDDIQRQRC